jgi:hypothetical protein
MSARRKRVEDDQSSGAIPTFEQALQLDPGAERDRCLAAGVLIHACCVSREHVVNLAARLPGIPLAAFRSYIAAASRMPMLRRLESVSRREGGYPQ